MYRQPPPMPTMFDEFSYMGYWWLPEKPTKEWAGMVTYNPECGIELELIVDSKEITCSQETSKIPDRVGVFHGRVHGYHGKITLVENKCKSRYTVRDSGIVSYCYEAEKCLAGNKSYSSDEIFLEHLEVSFSHLPEWMKLEWNFGHKIEGNKAGRAYRIQHELPRFDVPSISSLMWLHEVNLAQSNDSEYLAERKLYLSIVPDSPKSLCWFLKMFNDTRDLLTILAGIPMECKCITNAPGGYFSGKRDPLDIIYRVQLPNVNEDFVEAMPFSFDRLNGLFPDMCEAWFGLTEKERISFKLCQNVICSKGEYPILDFLALVHASENFHRLHYEEKGISEGKYKNEKGEVDRKAPNLMHRLQELRGYLPADLVEGIHLTDDFLKRVKDSRNYYSHYNSDDKDKVMIDTELDDAIFRLIPFIGYFLYRKLNIPDDVIDKALERAKYFGLWQRPWPAKPKTGEQEQPSAN